MGHRRRAPRGTRRAALSPLGNDLLVLLPPSEAKAPGGDGPPMPGAPTSLPALTAPRLALARAVAALAADPGRAAAALLLPPSTMADALADDAAVLTAPTRPALERYTGVLYDALAAGTLRARARRWADEHLLVFSGLWGVSRGGDPVPAYRVPAAATVPGIGALRTFWRGPLTAALPEVVGDRLVLDARSTDYAALWAPTGEVRRRTVRLRVLDGRTGAPRVVSHHSKHGKGRFVRAVVEQAGRGRPPRTVADLADLGADLGYAPAVGERHLDLVES